MVEKAFLHPNYKIDGKVHINLEFKKIYILFHILKKISVLQFLPGNLLLNTALYKVSFHLLGEKKSKNSLKYA